MNDRTPKPSRWAHILEIIWGEYRNFQADNGKAIGVLLKQSPHSFETPAAAKKWIVEQEQRFSVVLDEACQKFARDATWPKLGPEELLLLMQRLKQAKEFLELFVGRFPHLLPSPDKDRASDGQIIEFLLVYFWAQFGRERYLCEQCLHL